MAKLDRLHAANHYKSNGFDKFNDTDINATRYAASILLFSLIPFHIVVNLLTVIIICVFRRLQNTQNILVASNALNGLLAGLVFNPIYASYWFPGFDLSDILNNEKACMTLYAPIMFIGVSCVIHLTMITAERFFAVIYPLRYLNFMSIERLRWILAAVWIFVAVYSMLPYVWNDYRHGQCELYTTISATYLRYFTFPILVFCNISSSIFNVIVFRTAFYQKRKLVSTMIRVLSKEYLQSSKEQVRRTKLVCFLYFSYLVFFAPYLISIFSQLSKKKSSKSATIFHTAASAFSNIHFTCSTLVYVFIKKQSRKAIKLVLTTPPWQWATLRSYRLHGEDTDGYPSSAHPYTFTPTLFVKSSDIIGSSRTEKSRLPSRRSASATGSVDRVSSCVTVKDSQESSQVSLMSSSVDDGTKSPWCAIREMIYMPDWQVPFHSCPPDQNDTCQ